MTANERKFVNQLEEEVVSCEITNCIPYTVIRERHKRETREAKHVKKQQGGGGQTKKIYPYFSMKLRLKQAQESKFLCLFLFLFLK